MDEFGLKPSASVFEDTGLTEDEELQQQDTELDTETKELADTGNDPKFPVVEGFIKEAIKDCERQVDADLPANEYKTEDLSNRKTVATLKALLKRINDAVTATEPTKEK